MGSLSQCFTESSIHWLIDSLKHRFVDSPTQWFTDSLIHWITEWLILRFIGSLLVDSLCQCFVAWMILWFNVHWLYLVHRFIDSLVHSVSCAWVFSFHVSGTWAAICSFVDASHNFNTSLLLNHNNFPRSHLLPIVVSFFRNFRLARAGHYLVLW